MMLQFTKVGIEKPWRLTIILVRESRDPPAYEGIDTAIRSGDVIPMITKVARSARL